MPFPASPSNNDVHKVGNRAFAYDSALGTWDQVRETDRTENKVLSGELSGAVTKTFTKRDTFPPGHIIQTVNNSYGGGGGGTNSTSMSSTSFQKVVDSNGDFKWHAKISDVTAGNDILVHCIFNGYVTNNAVNAGGSWGIIRATNVNETDVFHHTGGYNDWDSLNHYWYSMVNLQFLDVNPGAGSIKYFLGCRKYGGSSTMNVNSVNIPFNMTLQEVQR